MPFHHNTSDSFRPFIPADKVIPEFTLRTVVVGALFGLIFSSVTVYLGLKVAVSKENNNNQQQQN